MPRTNLKALSRAAIESFVVDLRLPSFRAKQLLHWIYEKQAQSIEDITELSKGLRERLSEVSYIGNLQLLDRQVSKDATEKFLFGLEDKEAIESVLIPDEERLTLCISSQVGCALGCKFCLTGSLGLKRNLEAYEIIDQLIFAQRLLAPRTITNIVFMGMGEPLANLDNVVDSLWRINELLKISPRKVTLSTSGVAPKILELSRRAPAVNISISLNATTDEERDSIMPINKVHPIRELLDACRKFPVPPRRHITFEYVLLKGINDADEDAKRLISLLKGIPSKVNLIPFNPVEGCQFQRPDDERILRFQKIIANGNLSGFIRKSKGQDILAACGQLKAKDLPNSQETDDPR